MDICLGYKIETLILIYKTPDGRMLFYYTHRDTILTSVVFEIKYIVFMRLYYFNFKTLNICWKLGLYLFIYLFVYTVYNTADIGLVLDKRLLHL